MKRKLILIAAAVLTGGWVYAQAQEEEYDFRDAKGNLTLWNSEWRMDGPEGGKLNLVATGRPAKAASKNQGLTLEANNMLATLIDQGKGQLAFDTATLDGNVKVHQVRQTNDGQIIRDLNTQKLKLSEGKEIATTTLSVPFTLNDELKPSRPIRPRVLNIKAASGTLVTTPYQEQKNNDIKSADIRSATVRLEQGVKPGEKEPTTSTSTAESSSMSIKKEDNYILTFASRVDFSDHRDSRLQFGQGSQDTTMSGNSGTITLDDLKAESEQPVISANLQGDIKITFRSVTPIDGDVQYTTIDATGDKLTFSRETRKIRITGNVKGNYKKYKKSQSEDDIIPYQLQGSEIEITLTEDFRRVQTVGGTGGTARAGGGG